VSNLNLKPLAWGLLGAGVAVMGTAGALDLPSWLHHSTASAGTTAAAVVNPAPVGEKAVPAPTPTPNPLPSLPPGTAPNYRAIVQQFGPAVVHVSVAGTHKQTAEEAEEEGIGPGNPLFPFFRGMPEVFELSIREDELARLEN